MAEGIITLGIGSAPADLTHFLTLGLDVGDALLTNPKRENMTNITLRDRRSFVTLRDRTATQARRDRRSSAPSVNREN